MDQIKQFIAFVKKQHFWILCGLVILIGLVMNAIAGSKFTEDYTKGKANISSIDQGLNPLVQGADHPNRDWADQVQKKTDDLRNNVRDAWEALYNEQKQRIFVWPSVLGADFVTAFNQPTANTDPRKMVELCERYQSFIKTELKHLGEIVNAEWVEEGADDAPRRRPMSREPGMQDTATNPQKIYTVNWDSDDQKRLMLAYDWQEAPSVQDVRYAQEEIWVLDAICRAIARTNTGARGPYEAVVRDVNKMLVGYDAVDRFPLGEGGKRIRHLTRPSAAAAAAAATPQPMTAGGPAGMPAMPLEAPKRPARHKTGNGDDDTGPRPGMGMSRFQRGPGGPGMPPGSPGGPPMSGAPAAGGAGTGDNDPDAWLKDNRYVNAGGRPLLTKDLQTPGGTAEYNLMEFRLNLTVDEVRWEKLLLELCNSPLPLEVREVRINISDDPDAVERNLGSRRPSSMRMAEGDAGVQHNTSIEIRGVAYLINPPNFEKLGLTTGNGAGAPTAPGAVPVNPAAAKTPPTGAVSSGATPATSGATSATGAAPAPTGGPPGSATPSAPLTEAPPISPDGTNPAPGAPVGASGTTPAGTPPSVPPPADKAPLTGAAPVTSATGPVPTPSGAGAIAPALPGSQTPPAK